MNALIVFAARYLFLLSTIIFGWFFIKLDVQTRKEFGMFAILASLFSYITARLLSALYYDPRPFVITHIQPLIPHAADNGFPSDHTLLTMVIAVVVFTYNRKLGLLLGVVSIIVGISRVLAGVHNPIDILGAVGIAAIVTCGTRVLVHAYSNHFSSHK